MKSLYIQWNPAPYDHLVITTIFSPTQVKVHSFPLFYNPVNPNTPLLRSHFFTAPPKVVVLMRFRCTTIDWACGLRQGLAKQHDVFLRYHESCQFFYWQARIKIVPPKQGLCSKFAAIFLLCTPKMEKDVISLLSCMTHLRYVTDETLLTQFDKEILFGPKGMIRDKRLGSQLHDWGVLRY